MGIGSVRAGMRNHLLDFLVSRRHTAVTDAQVERSTAARKRARVFFGQW